MILKENRLISKSIGLYKYLQSCLYIQNILDLGKKIHDSMDIIFYLFQKQVNMKKRSIKYFFLDIKTNNM